MSKRILISCDGPKCKREIDSTIHAGSWLTLLDTDVFGDDSPSTIKRKEHKYYFCSYECLRQCIQYYTLVPGSHQL